MTDSEPNSDEQVTLTSITQNTDVKQDTETETHQGKTDTPPPNTTNKSNTNTQQKETDTDNTTDTSNQTHDTTTPTTPTDPQHQSKNMSVPPEDRDWDLRTVCDSYPKDANFYYDASNTFTTNNISELRSYIINETNDEWTTWLSESGLHRCAGCNTPLQTLTELYCTDCEFDANDKIPCQNCGEKRVKIRDPFCSATCASEYMNAMNGNTDPLEQPAAPSDDWLDHPFRTEYGIPTAAPLIANNTFVCREDYLYGDDLLHDLAVHVAESHTDGWGAYIEKYKLNRCRVCNKPVTSLLPIHDDTALEEHTDKELQANCDYTHCPKHN